MDVPEKLLESIREAVGDKGWTTDAGALAPHLVELRGLWRGECAMAVSPANTDEVAAVVRLCHDAGVPVVPQGGNTGLVGGGVPQGGILLSLRRLNRIREVDPVNATLTCEAGCVLADIQRAADDAGLLFPLSLGAEGSCQIGGNLSTNAGGVQVLRYGTARDLVLGLEVVLADGRVWDGLRALRKDNTGYDLKQLFIGAEGTLGVITAAVLKLFPKPGRRETALAAVPEAEAALGLFQRLQGEAADALTAFEFMDRQSVELAVAHVQGVADPFDGPHPGYALIELSGAGGGTAAEELRETIERILAKAFEDGVCADAVIAASGGQAEALWRLRDAVPEAQRAAGASIKHDVAVPVSRVPEFLERARPLVEDAVPGARIVAFGHLGDGNLHYNLSQPEAADADAFLAGWERVNRLVHDLVDGMGGSFSAEHGIGLLKRAELERYKAGPALDLMRALKAAFDPKGIMNPGKVL
ncbi:MAG: FAD-binding oxidoreductase [Rhodospirillales bacterium]